jgi:hypothetical protein
MASILAPVEAGVILTAASKGSRVLTERFTAFCTRSPPDISRFDPVNPPSMAAM